MNLSDIYAVYDAESIGITQTDALDDLIRVESLAGTDAERMDIVRKWAQQLRAELDGDAHEAAANADW